MITAITMWLLAHSDMGTTWLSILLIVVCIGLAIHQDIALIRWLWS
jgi:hypothetical protein